MCAVFAACLLVTLTTTPLLQTSTVAALCLLGLIGLLIFPIGGLFAFHIVLVSKGRTTNEHVTGKYKGMNLFSRGCCPNMLHLLCGSLTPRYRRVIHQHQASSRRRPAQAKEKQLALDDIEIQSLNTAAVAVAEQQEARQSNTKTVSSVTQDQELLDLVLKNKKAKTAIVSADDEVPDAGSASSLSDQSVSSSMLNKDTRRNHLKNTSLDSNKLSTKINSK